jgi:hypothetical protein
MGRLGPVPGGGGRDPVPDGLRAGGLRAGGDALAWARRWVGQAVGSVRRWGRSGWTPPAAPAVAAGGVQGGPRGTARPAVPRPVATTTERVLGHRIGPLRRQPGQAGSPSGPENRSGEEDPVIAPAPPTLDELEPADNGRNECVTRTKADTALHSHRAQSTARSNNTASAPSRIQNNIRVCRDTDTIVPPSAGTAGSGPPHLGMQLKRRRVRRSTPRSRAALAPPRPPQPDHSDP